MSKFNQPQKIRQAAKARITSPIVSQSTPGLRTFNGAQGFGRDTKSELFLLAVCNFVGEDTFYEKGKDRDARYRALVQKVALEDPEWTVRFLKWLRAEGNMRSAPLVGALEFVRARLQAKVPSVPAYELPGFTDDRGLERAIVNAVLQRADEPGEALAYWISTYGRPIPKPVKRGIADAALRLYTQRALIKYDTDSKGFRFGDVIRLTGAKAGPEAAKRSGRLFRSDGETATQQEVDERIARWITETTAVLQEAVDRRKGVESEPSDALWLLRANRDLRERLQKDPKKVPITAETLNNTGITWEYVFSLLGSKQDKKVLWEALIPSMGYMALLRNLRNFDEAGVSDKVADEVAAKLADPNEVAQSRQLPFRFLSAYRALNTVRWSAALEKALTASLSNIPWLDGRTLILVDRSPSMFPMWSHLQSPKVKEQVQRTGITLADQAALFGTAVALRCADATVVQYGAQSELVNIPPRASVLLMLNRFGQIDGTDTFAAAGKFYSGHDRVIVITDEQTSRGINPIPANVPMYTWNIGGYQPGHEVSGSNNRHTFGGLTDHAFRLIPLLESGRNGNWPF